MLYVCIKHSNILEMNSYKKIIVSLLFFSIVFFGCERIKVEVVEINCDEVVAVYDTQSQDTTIFSIKTILDNSCSVNSSCHLGNEGLVGYDTYLESSKSFIESNTFNNRVFEKLDMPPPYAEAENALSDINRELLRCWMEAGFPETE